MCLPVLGATVTSEQYGVGTVLSILGPQFATIPSAVVQFADKYEQRVPLTTLTWTESEEDLQLYSLGVSPLNNGY